MQEESIYLAEKLAREATRVCGMQVVFADVVAYSSRKTHRQISTILAFTRCFKNALSATASAYTDQLASCNAHLQRDTVTVPTGDGVALGFPFDGIEGMAIDFVDCLVTAVHAHNTDSPGCLQFDALHYCDCHDKFLLRIGISEGKTVLHRDLNGRINMAGYDVNLAARVMGLAQPGQVMLTDLAHRTINQLLPARSGQFRTYYGARVKHDILLDVHQYKNDTLTGLDVRPIEGLDLAGPDRHTHTTRTAVPEVRRSKPEPAQAASPLLAMVQITEEKFTMGTKVSGRFEARFSKPFLISARLVSQGDYIEIVGSNPSQFVAPTNPVERVSWYDAVRFCNALSAAEGYVPAYQVHGQEVSVAETSDGYRLPTEAEWELCARGEAGEDVYGLLTDIAWYSANSNGGPRPVGELRPIRGIYDLLGNVWEWCWDWYERDHPTGTQLHYAGPRSGSKRVIRGGSWRDQPSSVSAGSRGFESPSKCDGAIGFRVVRVPQSLAHEEPTAWE